MQYNQLAESMKRWTKTWTVKFSMSGLWAPIPIDSPVAWDSSPYRLLWPATHGFLALGFPRTTNVPPKCLWCWSSCCFPFVDVEAWLIPFRFLDHQSGSSLCWCIYMYLELSSCCLQNTSWWCWILALCSCRSLTAEGWQIMYENKWTMYINVSTSLFYIYIYI